MFDISVPEKSVTTCPFTVVSSDSEAERKEERVCCVPTEDCLGKICVFLFFI